MHLFFLISVFVNHLARFCCVSRDFFHIRITKMQKGPSHFDAEDVIGNSSPYKGTAEMPSASKKPHKNEETHRKISVGFNLR